ncbi:hypothetical protein C8R44DRAFT_737074 [Mycena epipterygia]|nr:hypothetical protein C8R44DRAFT_737074 [Mycena epipterygia]
MPPGISMNLESHSQLSFRTRRELSPKEDKILKKNPLPPHWRAPCQSQPFGTLRWTFFNLLCIASLGHTGLERLWAAMKLEEDGDDSVWDEGMRQTCDRLNNMIIVASLLLTTTAAFITTTPPRAAMVNYTLRGPYICMLAAFGLLIGGIIVAAAAFLVTTKSRPYWLENALYATRFRVYCTLFMLSYPFCSIGTAALSLVFGILSSVWGAEDLGIKAAAPLLLVVPISIAVLFSVACSTIAPESDEEGGPDSG